MSRPSIITGMNPKNEVKKEAGFIPIENPLPLPKKRKHRQDDFDLPENPEDDFDIITAETDDFDLE